MPEKLNNSLLEMLVVLGMDESSGMIPTTTQTPSFLENPFSICFNVEILAAISSHVAIFPGVSQRSDDSYPPQQTKKISESEGSSWKTLVSSKKLWASTEDKYSSFNGNGEQTKHVQSLARSLSRRGQMKPVDFMPKHDGEKTATLRSNELPLGVEMLDSLRTFCFPDDYYIFDSPKQDFVHFLILTDIVGAHTYAACLTRYIPYYVNKIHDSWRCKPCTKSDDRRSVAYLPRCFVFISKFPYFTVMKDCISRLVNRVQENPDEWQRVLKEFALQLSLTVTPPPGNVALQFQLYDVQMTIPSSDTVDRLPTDYNLSIMFQFLDAQTILTIVSALLMQQRILFLSSSYAILTLIMHSFVHILQPFKWQYTFVPVLSLTTLELVEAPGTFMMGCHSKHKHLLEEIEDILSVNLDHGTIHISDPLVIPAMPKHPASLFKDSVKRLLCHLELWRFESATCFSYEETRRIELTHQYKTNHAISQMFLELQINLFRDIFLHINPDKRFFHKDKYLEGIDETDRPFYDQVLVTEMFNVFLKERFENKQDFFSDAIQKTMIHSRSSISLLGHSPDRGQRLRNAFSMSNLLQLYKSEEVSDPFEKVVFKLPNFMFLLSHLYLNNCYNEVSTAMIKLQPFTAEMESLLYIRGMLSAARANKMAALEDFCTIHSSNSRLFPKEFVLELLTMLSNNERTQLEEHKIYKTSPILQEIESSKDVQKADQPIVMQLNKIPKNEINLEGFTQLLNMLEITAHYELSERLFQAFTLGKLEVVDPATFEEFYKCWKDNEEVVQRAKVSDFVFDDGEVVLKFSESVKCSIGFGHLVLTQNRLLFRPEGSTKPQEVCKLKNVDHCETGPQRSFFKEHMALRIFYKDSKTKHFTATLREDSQKWLLFLHEMCAGKSLSEELKDPLVENNAMQNVLILDAYLRSSEAEFTCHQSFAQQMAPSLCYFMAKKSEMMDRLSYERNKLLLRQLDPNVYEAKRVAVHAIICTSGYDESDKSSTSSGVVPRLWCGLTNGKVLVYNAISGEMESILLLADDRVTCLLSVSSSQDVWAGSFDNHIYIMENNTDVTCNQKLSDHKDKVVDMTTSLDGRSVYTAGLNGLVLIWDAETRKKCGQFQMADGDSETVLLKIHYHGHKLWCCTRDELFQMSLDGTILARVSFTDDKYQIKSHLDCFVITDQNEVWIGLGRVGQLRVCTVQNLELKRTIDVPCRGVSTLACLKGKVWVGSKQGHIYIFDSLTFTNERHLAAHSDAIRTMIVTKDLQVITGSGSADGKIAVWKSD